MSDVLFQVYLFVVIFSFLLWITTPEKAEAVIKEEVNLVGIIDDSQYQNSIQDKEVFSKDNEFEESEIIPKNEVNIAIKSLNVRDLRKVAKRLGIKQKTGQKTRSKNELIQKILERMEINQRKVIEVLQEIALI
jgi:hypothetical protein